jgi:hypothetical protein
MPSPKGLKFVLNFETFDRPKRYKILLLPASNCVSLFAWYWGTLKKYLKAIVIFLNVNLNRWFIYHNLVTFCDLLKDTLWHQIKENIDQMLIYEAFLEPIEFLEIWQIFKFLVHLFCLHNRPNVCTQQNKFWFA